MQELSELNTIQARKILHRVKVLKGTVVNWTLPSFLNKVMYIKESIKWRKFTFVLNKNKYFL